MEYIKSPLNYIGGKYKLLPQIMPLFPDNIDKFVDLFAGGVNVGINVKADRIYVNDLDYRLIEIYEWLDAWPTQTVIEVLENLIKSYGLNMHDPEPYLRLREDYNCNPRPQWLLLLIFYSFNHQIRYNQNHNFNMPFGRNRSQYNPQIKANLIKFCDRLHSGEFVFSHESFQRFSVQDLTSNSLVYCDPPYYISTATYNENGGWDYTNDEGLRVYLDNLNYFGIKFAMSNVFKHKGETNEGLMNWAKDKHYNVHFLDMDYKNCSYHLKDRESPTVEVLITNY